MPYLQYEMGHLERGDLAEGDVLFLNLGRFYSVKVVGNV